MRTTKEEQRRVLNMDIRTFIDENFQDSGIRTRLIHGLWTHSVQPAEKVKDLWFKKGGRLPLHPLRYFRNIGRKSEIEFEAVLERYDLYFGHPIDKILEEEDESNASKTMKVIIHDNNDDFLISFDNWKIPLPLVNDKVETSTDVWIVCERVFEPEDNCVSLYCIKFY